MMTHRQRLQAAVRGDMPDHIPFGPRIDLWHNANSLNGTLPKRHRGKTRDQVALSEGWALHKTQAGGLMSKSDHVANLVVIGLGIFVVYYSYYYLKLGILIAPGAGFLPFLCGLALVALAVIWRLQTTLFKPRSKAGPVRDPLTATGEAERAPQPVSWVKLVLAFATTVVYAVLFERIGFFLATLVFMLTWQVVVERRHWLKAIVITVLCSAAMYLLFRLLLHVELPPNPLFG